MSKTPTFTPDVCQIYGKDVRCVVALSIVDAKDVLSIFMGESALDKAAWKLFKQGIAGVRKIHWSSSTRGTGRLVVRADIIAEKLRAYRRGKCTTCLQLADELIEKFPNAGLVQDPVVQTHTVQVEDIDNTNGKLVPVIKPLLPSNDTMQEKFAMAMLNMMPDVHKNALFQREQSRQQHEHRLKEMELRQREAEVGVLEDEREAKRVGLEDERNAKRARFEVDKLHSKIQVAKTLGNETLIKEFEQQLARL